MVVIKYLHVFVQADYLYYLTGCSKQSVAVLVGLGFRVVRNSVKVEGLQVIAIRGNPHFNFVVYSGTVLVIVIRQCYCYCLST